MHVLEPTTTKEGKILVEDNPIQLILIECVLYPSFYNSRVVTYRVHVVGLNSFG